MYARTCYILRSKVILRTHVRRERRQRRRQRRRRRRLRTHVHTYVRTILLLLARTYVRTHKRPGLLRSRAPSEVPEPREESPASSPPSSISAQPGTTERAYAIAIPCASPNRGCARCGNAVQHTILTTPPFPLDHLCVVIREYVLNH